MTTVFVFLSLVIATTVVSSTQYGCKAYDHKRWLKVDGCKSLHIHDRYCKGLCSSEHFPKLHEDDNVEMTSEDLAEATRYMCKPSETETALHMVACKKEVPSNNPDIPSEWVSFKKMVAVNVTKSCSCQTVRGNEGILH